MKSGSIKLGRLTVISSYTSLSPPAPSSNLAPPTASISSKKMRQAFLVLEEDSGIKTFVAAPNGLQKRIQSKLANLAISKSSRTILAPSPTYFCTNSDPITLQAQHSQRGVNRAFTHLMKQASVLLATARAHRVLPVPGGPYSRTPFGGSIPRLTKRSGWRRGVSTTSLSFSICSLQPPTSL